MAKRLAREEGLLVGTSSGLNIAAAVQLARELGPGKTVTTVAVDTGLKYSGRRSVHGVRSSRCLRSEKRPGARRPCTTRPGFLQTGTFPRRGRWQSI